MGGLFSKPKSVKMPAVPQMPPVPVVKPEVEEETIRRAKKRYGFEKTILTGDLIPASSGKKTTFG